MQHYTYLIFFYFIKIYIHINNLMLKKKKLFLFACNIMQIQRYILFYPAVLITQDYFIVFYNGFFSFFVCFVNNFY